MRSILDTLREKELEFELLRREVEILRAAVKIVANDHNGSGSRRRGLLSHPQMIRVVLLAHGRPLHVDKIALAIEKRFDVKLKRTDITPTIYRAIRNNKLFRKQGTNTFGLVEWSSSKPDRNSR
jgi:hypothetical protein